MIFDGHEHYLFFVAIIIINRLDRTLKKRQFKPWRFLNYILPMQIDLINTFNLPA
jgi:hypothetical protein